MVIQVLAGFRQRKCWQFHLFLYSFAVPFRLLALYFISLVSVMFTVQFIQSFEFFFCTLLTVKINMKQILMHRTIIKILYCDKML